MIEEEKLHECKGDAFECCDHWCTEYITCPRCGSSNTDSFECGDEGEDECPDCELKFTYSRHIEITYSTEAIKDKV